MENAYADIVLPPQSNRLLLVAGPFDSSYNLYKEQLMKKKNERLYDGNVFLAAGEALGKAVIETTIGLTNIGKKGASHVIGKALEGISKTPITMIAKEKPPDQIKFFEQPSKLQPIRYGDVIYITPVTSDSEQRTDSFLLNGILTTESIILRRSYVADVKKDWEIENPWLSLYRIQYVSCSKKSYETESRDSEIKIVQQGESFVLQQLYTEMYLCSLDDEFADLEKDCLKLSVATNENPSCHFVMKPKYITRSNGAIYYEDQVIISNLKSSSELHLGASNSCYGCVGLETLGNTKHTEVNLFSSVGTRRSMEKGTTTWRVHLYGEMLDNPHEIKVGDFVRIHHMNLDGYLWGSMNKTIIDRPFFNSRKVHYVDRLSHVNQSQARPLDDNEFGANQTTQGNLVVNKPPQFILNDPMGAVTIKTLFRIEQISVLSGGVVLWSGDTQEESHFYRLRHVATGCYLAVLKVGYGSEAYVTKLTKPSKWMHLSKKAILKYMYGTLFQLHPTSDMSLKKSVNWKNSMMKIVHLPIPPPDEKFFEQVVSTQSIAAGHVLVQVNDRCVPFSARSHMNLVTSLPVVLTAGNLRPRAKKTPYPSISITREGSHPIKPSDSPINFSSKLTQPHKAEVKFMTSEKENDTIGLEQPNFLDTAAALASVAIRQYFDRFEDAWYLHMTAKYGTGGKAFPEDSLREVSGILKGNIEFLRVEGPKKYHKDRYATSNGPGGPPSGPPDVSESSDPNDVSGSGEKKNFLDSVKSVRTDVVSGLRETRIRNQFFNYSSRLLDRVFWLLRLPTVLGSSWQTEIANNPELQIVFELINTSLIYATNGHAVAQDYVARSSFFGWRALDPMNFRMTSTDILLDERVREINITSGVPAPALGATPGTINPKDHRMGYLIELNYQLSSNPYAAKILKVTLTENRELLLELVCDHFIHDCITIIRRYGPSKHVLEILANICSGGGTPLMITQEIVLNTLYSSSDEKEYLENRLALTIESIYFYDMDTISTSATTCMTTGAPTITPLSPLFVTWHGSKNYLLGDNLGSELFFDIETLQLPFIEAAVTSDLKRYFQRIDLEKTHLKWVNLVDIAWYIDPENCCNFWIGNPKSQWEDKKAVILSNPQLVENVERLKQISLHCYGVFDVASKLCSGRSYKSIRALERQYCFPLCLGALKERKLPTPFRRVLGCLLHNLYINRFPHVQWIMPSPIREFESISKMSTFNSALQHSGVETTCSVSELGFTAMGMDDLVEDELKPGTYLRYYDYLQKYRPIVLSHDRRKFSEVQDVIAQYFLGIDYSHLRLDKMINSAPKNVRGGSELENFKFSRVMLVLLKELMVLGFYHDIQRLPEIFYIAAVVMSSHRSTSQIFGSNLHDSSQPLDEEEVDEDGGEGEDLIDEDKDSFFGDDAIENIGSAFSMIKQIREGMFDGEDEEKEDRNLSSNSAGAAAKKLKSLQYHEEGGSNLQQLTPTNRSGGDGYMSINVEEDLAIEGPRGVSLSVAERRSSLHSVAASTALSAAPEDRESRRGPELTRMCTRHDRTKFPEFLRMHIYENQRWFGFSYELEIVLSTRGPFSSPYKDLMLVFNRKHTIDENPDDPGGLPDFTWKWVDDWTIQTIEKKDPSSSSTASALVASSSTASSSSEEYMRSEDSEGWFYALDWMYEFSPQKGIVTSNVRKRRWERTCREKTALEFIDELLDKGYTDQNLMKVLSTNRNISGDGIFDFKKILQQLEHSSSSKQSVRLQSQSRQHLSASKVQFQNTISNANQEKEEIREVSAECLTTCLQTIGVAFDILCDSRISIFTHTFLHAPPPRDDGLTMLANGKMKYGFAPAPESHGLWHIVVDPQTSRRITTLTKRGKEWFEDLNSVTPKAVHIANPLPLNYFETQYLELVLDSDHTLCDNSLTILRRCHRRQAELMEHLENFVLLSNEESHRFGIAKSMLRIFRNDLLVYFQTPLNETLILKLTSYLQELNKCMFPASSSRPCRNLQSTMRVLKGYVSVLKIMLHGIYSPHVQTKSFMKELELLWQESSNFINFFCSDNLVNQKALHPAIDYLIEGVNTKFPGCPYVIHTIESIFRNVHISQISVHAETLVTRFLRVISLDKMSCGLASKITSFFQHIILPSGTPSKLNQALLLDEMLSMTNRSKVELFDARRYRVDLQSERTSLIKEFVREGNLGLTIYSPEISKAKLREHLLLYHAECIELIALCCSGPNNSISASRCMPVLPLEILLEVLSNRETYKCIAIATSYGLFLRHVYLGPGWSKIAILNEDLPTDLMHYDPLWQVLSHCCGILGEDLKGNQMYRGFIFNVALPCLEIVLTSVTHDQSDANNLLSTNSGGGLLDIIILSTKRSLATLLNDSSLSHTERLVVESAASALGVNAYDFMITTPPQSVLLSNAMPLEDSREDGLEIEMSPSPSHSATPSTAALASPHPPLSEDPSQSPTLVSENLIHLQNLIKECPVIQTVQSLSSTCTHLSHHTQMIRDQFCDFVKTIYEYNVTNDSKDSASKKETSTTATTSTPSEAETSTVAGGSNASNPNGKITFSALARRFISFCREDIVKMQDGNEGSQFAALVEIFNPTHPKMRQIRRDTTAVIFDNHECIQNVLFVLKLLTEILQVKKNQEERSDLGNRTDNNESRGGVGLESFEDVQIMMTRNSACALIIEIIASSPFFLLKKQALLFGIELLWNGNLESQQSLLSYLRKHNCVNFFRAIFTELQELTRYRRELNFHRKKRKYFAENRDEFLFSSSTAEESPPDMEPKVREGDCGSLTMLVDVYRFIQLMCEGHNYQIQMLLEDQSSLYSSQIQNTQIYSIQKSYGLLSQTVALLNEFIPTKDDSQGAASEITNKDAHAIKAMFDFLIESVQGPCYFNQEILASNPMFVDVIDRIWHATGVPPSKHERLHHKLAPYEEAEKDLPIGYSTMKILKTTAITLRLSLLEGRKLSTSDIVVQMFTRHDSRGARYRVQGIFDEYRTVESLYKKMGYPERKIKRALGFVLQEAALVLSVVRILAEPLPEVSNEFVPKAIRSVKRSHYSSSEEYKLALKDNRDATRYFNMYSMLDDKLNSIEIMWTGKGLFAVSFVMPRQSQFLTKVLRDKIINSIDYTDDDKVTVFLSKTRQTIAEMNLTMKLVDMHLHSLLLFQDELATAIFSLSVLINFLLVIGIEKGYFTGQEHPQYAVGKIRVTVMILVYIQCALCLYRLFQTSLIRLPLAYEEYRHQKRLYFTKDQKKYTTNKKWRIFFKDFSFFFSSVTFASLVNGFLYMRYHRLISEIVIFWCVLCAIFWLQSLYHFSQRPWMRKYKLLAWYTVLMDFALDEDVKSDLAFAIISLVCLNVDIPYFNSLILLYVIKLSVTLQNVVNAVAIPRHALFMSALLGFISILIFTEFGFYFFSVEFFNAEQSVDECSNMILCLSTFVHGGFLSGGGIADHINDLGHELLYSDSSKLTARIAYDVCFFVVIIVLLLNIIFGIIIDTFGQLREESSEKQELMASFCFICGISKDVFDSRASNGALGGVGGLNFAGHIENEHNMWDYLLFLLYLQEKNPNDYNGIESYVAKLYEEGDISWVPKGVARGINDATNMESAQAEQRMQSNLDHLAASMTTIMEATVAKHSNLQMAENDKLMQTLQTLESEILQVKNKLNSS